MSKIFTPLVLGPSSDGTTVQPNSTPVVIESGSTSAQATAKKYGDAVLKGLGSLGSQVLAQVQFIGDAPPENGSILGYDGSAYTTQSS